MLNYAEHIYVRAVKIKQSNERVYLEGLSRCLFPRTKGASQEYRSLQLPSGRALCSEALCTESRMRLYLAL